MTTFFFTGTGNSLAVAKRIGGELVSIPQVADSPGQTYQDDAIGVVFPIYSLSAPGIVTRFLEGATLKADYKFAVGTYGNHPGAAMLNLRKTMEKRGDRLDYAAAVLMLDNFLPVFEVGSQISKLPKKNVEEAVAKIADDIRGRRNSEPASSIVARMLSGLLGLAGTSSQAKQARSYIVNSECTACGTCAKVCPTGNITVASKVEFGERCASCYACVHLCPHGAIHLKNERSGKRWRNPDVSLGEIIAANQRV
ncbi:MAG: EFR1 family ferrodoxin [Oscillospiraceae bacterium]|jgi:NAD-dependent dihydropyrimidine dehydrogenase PreA subunit|nr:EFR1 family ferrodoxin [Oscillospiraceae bacterium]